MLRYVAGRGEKSLLCDPGSEYRVGRRERRRCAKIMDGMRKKKKNVPGMILFFDGYVYQVPVVFFIIMKYVSCEVD